MWEQLVRRLTVAAGVPRSRMALHKKAKFAETFRAEILFRKHSVDEMAANKDMSPKFRDFQVNSSWREKIHRCLYKGIVKKSLLKKLQKIIGI